MVDEASVTVFHAGGQYTISLLDRVRVRVGVEMFHAHGPSIKLRLVSCRPIQPETMPENLNINTSRKEVG